MSNLSLKTKLIEEASIKLPKILKPYSFAKKNLTFSNSYDLSIIKTLREKVDNGYLQITLTFNFKDSFVIATGNIDFKVKVACVNCLELLDFSYKNMLKIAFVNNNFDENRFNSSLGDYEIIHCSFDEQINTFDLITDEVLLALPMFAKHNNNCINNFNTDKDLKIVNKENPFAILKDTFKK